MSKHSNGSNSMLLKLKLHFLGSLSYKLSGWMFKVDEQYTKTYFAVHGTRRLNVLMTEEAEYWKAKYRGNK